MAFRKKKLLEGEGVYIPRKKPTTYMTCLIAGFLFTALALGMAVYGNATTVTAFETLLLEHVDAAKLGMNEESLRKFAWDTIFYITGAVKEWNPQIIVLGLPAGNLIPQSFREHMGTVRQGVFSARLFLLMGFCVLALLLVRAVLAAKGRKGRCFSLAGYYTGLGTALIPVAVIAIWAVLGFDSLWRILHELLITDGIFDAMEPVMQLFPVSLFAGYLPLVAYSFAIWLAAGLALPLVLFPISKWLARQSLKKQG